MKKETRRSRKKSRKKRTSIVTSQFNVYPRSNTETCFFQVSSADDVYSGVFEVFNKS